MKLFFAFLFVLMVSVSSMKTPYGQIPEFETQQELEDYMLGLKEIEHKLKDLIHRFGSKAWSFIDCMVS